MSESERDETARAWAQQVEIVRGMPAEWGWDAAEDEAERLVAVARTAQGVACETCGGVGSYAYGSTSTWRGGIGGQAITSGVCDRCWGTGRSDRTGVDLRTTERRLAAAERERVAADALIDAVEAEDAAHHAYMRAAERDGTMSEEINAAWQAWDDAEQVRLRALAAYRQARGTTPTSTSDAPARSRSPTTSYPSGCGGSGEEVSE